MPEFQPLWPPLLVLTTPSGAVPFYWQGNPEMVVPFDVTRKSIRASEIDELAKKLGVPIKDVTKCASGNSQPDLVVGYRFTVKTGENGGLPYASAHCIRTLEPLDRVTMRTNWLDRTKDQTFTNCIVEDDPDVPYEAGGQLAGEEYYSVGSLTLIWLKETL